MAERAAYGTSHFLFEPIEFLEKLAAIIPRPAVNLLLSHGALAPRARWRAQAVSYGRPEPDLKAQEVDPSPRAARSPRAWTWPALMRRVFALDVLACPRCGGQLRVLATVQDAAVVRAILTHLGLAPGPGTPGPPRPNPTTLRPPGTSPGGPAGPFRGLPINDSDGRQGSRLPRSRAHGRRPSRESTITPRE